MKAKNEIIDAIKEMNSEQIFELNNKFCEIEKYDNDYYYINDDYFLNEMFTEKIDVARAVQYGDYNIHHEFVKFDGYGNLESTDFLDWEDLPDTLENIAECIVENYEDFESLF